MGAEDWKLDNVGVPWGLARLPQKFPNEIVKCGTIMMQDLTDKDWQVSRDGLFMPKVLEFINVLKIGLNDFTVSAFHRETD